MEYEDSEIVSEIEELKDEEVAQSYLEMVEKWALGDIVWEKLMLFEDSDSIVHTWTLVMGENEYTLLHSTPSPEPGTNLESSKKLYRTPSVEKRGRDVRDFIEVSLDKIYTRCDPPTPRNSINRTINPKDDNIKKYLKNTMKSVFNE